MQQVATLSRGGKSIVGRDRLEWRGDTLHRVRGRPVLLIVRDKAWPGMWRVRLPDGRTTDMVNESRARDAAMSTALAILSGRGVQETPSGGRGCAETVLATHG
jgi:hypothetical protein